MLTSSALLPPSKKGRRYERKALQIRNFAGVGLEDRLDPFALAAQARLRLVSLEDVGGLSAQARAQLLEADPRSWSGGASKPLPDGSRLVILNPTHGPARQAATLMEEICHIFLGHTANRIAFPSSGAIVSFRDYNQLQEEEAYAVGAAALVPYYVLRRAIARHLTARDLASKYGVSGKLVEYRIKVSGLWLDFCPQASDNHRQQT